MTQTLLGSNQVNDDFAPHLPPLPPYPPNKLETPMAPSNFAKQNALMMAADVQVANL
ncbi:MAG: hypothetical protein IPM11_13215 [Micropruina sp.]|nr:hypothetical protein [Micropruina sp.]